MSKINGDKSRSHRIDKKRRAKRKLMRERLQQPKRNAAAGKSS